METDQLSLGEALGIAACFALPFGIALYEVSRWLAKISPDGKDIFVMLLAAALLAMGVKAILGRPSMRI